MVGFYFYVLIVSQGDNGADAGVVVPVQGTRTSRRRSCGTSTGTRALSPLGAVLFVSRGNRLI